MSRPRSAGHRTWRWVGRRADVRTDGSLTGQTQGRGTWASEGECSALGEEEFEATGAPDLPVTPHRGEVGDSFLGEGLRLKAPLSCLLALALASQWKPVFFPWEVLSSPAWQRAQQPRPRSPTPRLRQDRNVPWEGTAPQSKPLIPPARDEMA